MKIVFVNDVIYAYASEAASANGGAERQQWLLARALSAAGWSVTVGVRETLQVGQRRTIDGVEFVGISRSQILLAWYRFLLSERPDWWYWRAAGHLWGPAVEIAKLVGVRAVFAAASDDNVHPSRALGRRRSWWPLYAWGLMRADRIFVQHGSQLSELAMRWRSKACIVPSIAGGKPAAKAHSERLKYVAWVGVLRQLKHPEILIEIARRMPNIRFVVCGGTTTSMTPPGYSRQWANSLSALPNVDFLGQVPPEKALQVIAGAAVLLSTSEREGFPSTFLEAWSSGTPVVSLKLDPDGIIQRAELGTVPQDVESAIADINALINSPQRRDELAARARRYVAEVHSEEAVIAALEGSIGDGHA